PVGRTGPDVFSGRTFAVTGEGLAHRPVFWPTHRTGAFRLVLTIAAAGATPLLRAENNGAAPESQYGGPRPTDERSKRKDGGPRPTLLKWRHETRNRRAPRHPPQDRAPLDASVDLPEDGREARRAPEARQRRRNHRSRRQFRRPRLLQRSF